MSKHRHEMTGTALQKSGGGLPAGYTQLEYVQTDAEHIAYIDPNIKIKPTYYIEYVFKINKEALYFYFGDSYFCMYYSAGNQCRFFNYNKSRIYPSVDSYIKVLCQNGKLVIYENDKIIYTVTSFAVNSSSLVLLNGRNNPKANYNNVYYCLVKDDDGNVLAEFIPAKRNEDGKIGMFNLANQTYYEPNQGDLIAGPEV